MSGGLEPLDWRNDPALREMRRKLASLMKEHAEAVAREDILAAAKALTKVERVLEELGIKSYSQLGL